MNLKSALFRFQNYFLELIYNTMFQRDGSKTDLVRNLIVFLDGTKGFGPQLFSKHFQ